MGLEYVDIFYHHRPDLETPLEETMGALCADCSRSGKALYVGLSNYDGKNVLNRRVKFLTIEMPVYNKPEQILNI